MTHHRVLRPAFWPLCLVLSAAGLFGTGAAAAAEPRRPNVVLILADKY